jgi:hypothetical protein
MAPEVVSYAYVYIASLVHAMLMHVLEQAWPNSTHRSATFVYTHIEKEDIKNQIRTPLFTNNICFYSFTLKSSTIFEQYANNTLAV